MAKLTLKEMKDRLTELVGPNPDMADLVWALAKDTELRVALYGRVEDAYWIFQSPPISKCGAPSWED